MALIDYNATKTFTETLQIDDIGNCTIKCEGTYFEGRIPFFAYYYMSIKTIMGKTSIVKFGPIDPDFPTMPNSFEASYKKINFKEPAIIKEIQQFVNDGLKGISKAEVVIETEAYEAWPDLQDTMENM